MGWGFLTRFYQQLASRCFAGGLQLILMGIIGAVGGAITALGLRPFTTLPVLVIGGIIGAGTFVAFVACAAFSAAIMFFIALLDNVSLDKDAILRLFAICAASATIGVGLAAALTPEIFAECNTAIAAGAVIGAIGLAVGWLATDFVILPMIKKIGECFSSEEPDQPLTDPNSTVKGTNVTEGGPELRNVNP